jgi:hypothetical protein
VGSAVFNTLGVAACIGLAASKVRSLCVSIWTFAQQQLHKM